MNGCFSSPWYSNAQLLWLEGLASPCDDSIIIIDYYPSSRVSPFLYILRRSPNSVSCPRSLLSLAKFDDLSSCFLRTALLLQALASSTYHKSREGSFTVSGKIMSSFVTLNFHSADSRILEKKSFSCVWINEILHECNFAWNTNDPSINQFVNKKWSRRGSLAVLITYFFRYTSECTIS